MTQKHHLITNLYQGMNTANPLTYLGENESGCNTYLTQFGFVQGEVYPLRKSSEKEVENLVDESKKAYRESSISLKNVTIKTYEGERIDTDHLILYQEQLIGVIKGKLF
ncbi:hypothetical protein [Thalassobacillus pellis]|uniref:hypothetical protein n=1 Tax=Thalassobacillus pellis TaxID=748008 RepID=UPI001960C850|nr:hypothetical protein [Thalassobacillus pellis]MBM7551861.1 hypothetical protein [Thalassobacillus pellis]